MERRARLTARLSSLSDFREVVRAMRAIAATHVQEAHGALASIRQYSEQIEQAIADAATLLSKSDDARLAGPAGEEAKIVIPICSEHGLSGAYSNVILERAETYLKDGAKIGLIGRKGKLIAEEQGLPLAWSFPMATHTRGVSTLCLNIMDKIVGFTHVVVVFAEYVSGGRYEVRDRQLAPLDPDLLARRASQQKPFHYLSPDVLIKDLTLEYVFSELMRAVMEGFASENGARLTIMEAADRNAEEKIERLSREEKAMRQEEVTSELLDIVIGAEVVRGKS